MWLKINKIDSIYKNYYYRMRKKKKIKLKFELIKNK